MKNVREFIAKNVASLLKDGDLVNLGVGIPTLAANYLPESVTIFIQAENGLLGVVSYAFHAVIPLCMGGRVTAA